MTPLRQRYMEDMQLRDLSEHTQDGYVSAVSQLAAYYGKSPAKISEEEIAKIGSICGILAEGNFQ